MPSYLLIESSEFSRRVQEYFGADEAYSEFQRHLTINPDSGQVIPGASPLRKVRWKDTARGKGKRGGLRVIYIHVPDIRVLFLLDVYDKDESDDLSATEKGELKDLARVLITQLRERFERER